jgi:hypothetical protein
MSDYILRFTLNNTTSGSLVIDEPDGWKEAMLKLERHEEFHSVIELYEDSFTFWAESYNYLVNIRDTQGFDADVYILVELSDDGATYETIFNGLIDIENSVEIDFEKIECPIVRNDLWSRFINNRGTSVNLQSTTDLYGNNRIVLSPITLNLPSQPIRHLYLAENDEDITYALTGSDPYGVIDFANPLADTIEEKYNYPRAISSVVPFELFALEWGGSYTINCFIYLSTGLGPSGQGDNYTGTTNVYFQKNDDAPIAFTAANQGIAGVNGRTYYEYISTQTFQAGDFLRFYIQGSSTVIWLDYYTSQLFVQADTTYDDSTAPAFMIHEAFQSVLDRIIGANNTLYSEYIGAEDTQQTDYASNGCASLCAITKGLHLKQYSLADKPFYASFNDLWEGHNPIFNLGLGYETVDGTEVIRIEDKAYFYDTTTSIELDYVNNIEVSLDTERVFKNIKIGYQKWEGESTSGIDDPQTKHEYAVQLKKSGRDIQIESKFIAASLAIENTRRKYLEQEKDWKLDNDTFIVAIDKDIIGSPALVYTPELDGPFSSVSDLDNSDGRYNLRLTPGRNFIRWINYFNSGLQLYTSYDYKFVSGEGNVKMSSTVGTDSCISGTIIENQNFDVTTDALHDNVVYSFDHPLSWDEYKTIRDNKEQAIGVSQTATGHEAFFIKSLEYNIHNAIGKFRLVKGIQSKSVTLRLIGSVGGNWSCDVSDGLSFETISLSGNGTVTTSFGQTNDYVLNVYKTSNSAISQANGSVKFYRNGNLQSIQSFSVLDDVSLNPGTVLSQVSYSDITNGEVITVLVTE